jgi:hypothetical protein
VDGFGRGRSLLPVALHLYGAALAFAWVAAAPFSAAVHEALDGQPGARRLIADGGIEVIAELGRSSPALWPAALAGVLPLLLVFLPLSVFLAGGAYGLAAERPERPWSRFWLAGAKRFRVFVVLSALGAVYAVATGAIASGLIAGISAGARAVEGRWAYWAAVGARAAVLLFASLHARSVVGFALACREARPDERLLPGFGRSLAMCWRRLAATLGIGAAFVSLQALSAVAGLALARAAGEGGWVAAAAAQAGWFGAAWLHAVEIRARIAYSASVAPSAAVRRPAEDASPAVLRADAEEEPCVP